MKNFLLLIVAAFACIASVDAQTIVSTVPSNRNVVLEEYTGIYCQYCPDGHRIATELEKEYPGDVFLINIHTGGYAVPAQGSGHLDLRTTAGDQLAVPAGITGYPAGSVNRSTSPWAMGRYSWEGVVKSQLLKTSPVNIGVEAKLDVATRELTVTVEYYYTADEANAKNYLTVALTQSDIKGYQTAGATYNPDQVTEDGMYLHQHALRMLLTSPVFGEEIAQTTTGTFGKKEYKVTLPASISDIDIDASTLDIVAFIAQSNSNILTAAGAKVDIPAENKVMLSLENQTVLPNSYFFDKINPVVKVTNNFETEVTSFDLALTMGGQTYTKTFDGKLAANESTVVDFGDITTNIGGYYSVWITGFSNINKSTSIYDWTKEDNKAKLNFIHFNKKAFAEKLFGFDNSAQNTNLVLDMSENSNFQLVSSSSNKYGAENTANAILFYIHQSNNVEGKPGYILFGEAELTAIEKPELSYYYAYSDGTFGGTAPTIKVEVSDNGGVSWNTVDSFTAVETNVGNQDDLFIPVSDDYLQHKVSLAAYKDKDVIIRVAGIPGTSGNSMWIDQIKVAKEDPTSVYDNFFANSSVKISPNPTADDATLEYVYTGNTDLKVDYSLVDMNGKTVANYGSKLISNGSNAFRFNAANLASGKYFLVISSNNTAIKQVSVVVGK